MGIIACIIFGILTAWITRSFQTITGVGGYKAMLSIGIVGGLAGLTGIMIGWGDFRLFNLYNVFLSIIITAIITIAWAKILPQPILTKS